MPYMKHTWTDEDIVSASRLNNIEGGIQEVVEAVERGLGASVQAYATAMPSLTVGVWGDAGFNAENYDVGQDYDPSTHVFTADSNGYYLVMAHITFHVAGTGDRWLSMGVSKNGSSVPGELVAMRYVNQEEVGDQDIVSAGILKLNASDTLKLMVGVNPTTDLTYVSTSLTIRLLQTF